MDGNGRLTEEQTLIYSFNGIGEKQIKAIMDKVLTALNQNTILVERQDITCLYYGSKTSNAHTNFSLRRSLCFWENIKRKLL